MFGKKDKELTPEAVTKLLEGIKDPELQMNLVKAGMVKDVKVESDRIRIGVELPTPAWDPREFLEQEIHQKLSKKAGDRKIEIDGVTDVEIPFDLRAQ